MEFRANRRSRNSRAAVRGFDVATIVLSAEFQRRISRTAKARAQYPVAFCDHLLRRAEETKTKPLTPS
jgi:hypothetical protein